MTCNDGIELSMYSARIVTRLWCAANPLFPFTLWIGGADSFRLRLPFGPSVSVRTAGFNVLLLGMCS